MIVLWNRESTKLTVLTGGTGATGRVQLHSHQNTLVISLLMIFPTHQTCVVTMDLAVSDKYLPYSV